MPTLKKRINISVDDTFYKEIERLKVIKQASSLSAVVVELVQEALEIQEDLYFAKLSDERSDESTLTHDEMWKK